MRRRRRFVFGAFTGLAALLAVFWITRAGADGIPTTGALAYSGRLEDVNGAPITGSKRIRIDVFDAVSGGANRCTVTQTVALANGRFQIILPDPCTDAARANPNLWIEVVVDDESLGRAKLQAVPYAVEAGRASAATGALSSQVVPRGAVMAFDLAACPAGWSAMTDAQGRVIVGTSTGVALDAKVGADQVTLTAAQMPAHAHGVNDPGHSHVVDNTINYGIPPTFSTAGGQGVGQAPIASRAAATGISLQNAGGGQPFDNRQASLALLYCKKD
jgi:hypothetical protein